jgi:hypothetical protein
MPMESGKGIFKPASVNPSRISQIVVNWLALCVGCLGPLQIQQQQKSFSKSSVLCPNLDLVNNTFLRQIKSCEMVLFNSVLCQSPVSDI